MTRRELVPPCLRATSANDRAHRGLRVDAVHRAREYTRHVSPPDDERERAPQPSLAARLRERYGTDVDPRVELDSESAKIEEARARAAPSAPASSVIGRLSTRGPVATRYRMQGEIARGGMGAILEVFDEDLRRRLAMKVILDRDSGSTATESRSVDPALLARFLEEAQVTGQLDHPGIVPVHELGLDPDGRVYFTMRLVHGRDLEAIFDLAAKGEEGWTTTRALGVLQKVCEAMAYAHAKGVVHRDLKPANVMVGRFGEVYVMDWGLARVRDHADLHDVRVREATRATPADDEQRAPRPAPATPSDAAPQIRASGSSPSTVLPSLHRVQTDRREASNAPSDEPLHTMDGDVIGTPSYMAPEQARGELAALDERTDVYAVGAMLYRLLSGTAPYLARGEKISQSEIWRRVVEGPPRALEELAPLAPAELVAICAKAMEREPSRRYADMLALSEDLRAFLEGRVVQAFEAGALAEARKWVRRNKPLAAALAAAVLILIAGLVASLLFAREAKQSATLAEQRRVDSDANAALAEQRRLDADANATLAEQRRQQADASATDARHQASIAKEANAFLNDDLLAAIAPEHEGKDVTVRQVLDQASARLDLSFASEPAVEAALRMTIGTSYSRLGEYETARKHLERALELRREHEGARSEPALQAMLGLASVLSDLDRKEESIALYERCIDLATELFGDEHRSTLSATNNLAIVLQHAGRVSEARELFEQVLPLEQRALGEEHHDTIATENNLAIIDQQQGKLADAEQRMRRVLDWRRKELGEKHPETAVATSNLANVLKDRGRLVEAEELSRSALAAMREIHGPDHPSVGRAFGTLGSILFSRGRLAEAEENFRESLRILAARMGDAHAETLTARFNLASSIVAPARRNEVEQMHREILEGRKKALGPEHRDTLESMNALGCAYWQMGRLDEGEKLLRETVALQHKVLGDDHPLSIIGRENLAGVLFNADRLSESMPILREVLETRRRVLGEDHPDVAKTMLNLATELKALDEREEGLAMATEACARSRKALGDLHPQVAQCLRLIGDLHGRSNERDEALVAYREALELVRKLHDADSTGYCLHQIGVMLLGKNDFDGAEKAISEACELRERVLGPDALGTCTSLGVRARVLLKLERYEDTEKVALQVVERAQRVGPKLAELLQRTKKLLVELYKAWGKPDEAEKWR